MLERVISGGQTGADLAGWRAARAAGIATGGWMVGHYWTEAGDRPELAEQYGATILPGVQTYSFKTQLRRRAEANVRDADATLCFDLMDSQATANADLDCRKLNKPFRCVLLACNDRGQVGASIVTHTPGDIAAWIRANVIQTLNVCGNRESKVPGIGGFVERYLTEVFRLLQEG